MSSWLYANEALLQVVMINATLAAALQLSLNAGMLSLAPVAFWGIGGFVGANLAAEAGWGLWPILVVVAVVSAVAAAIVSLPLTRLRGLAFAMATLAFLLIVQSLSISLKEWTGGALGLYGVPVLTSTGSLVVVAVVVALVLSQLERGPSGRRIDVLRTDESVSETMGIDVVRTRITIFSIAAAIGGVSGAMNALAFNSFGSDSFGFSMALGIIAMVVIGGMRSWVGAYLGALLLTMAPSWLQSLGDWSNVVYGVMVVVVIGYFSDGLLGLIRRAAALVRTRVAREAA